MSLGRLVGSLFREQEAELAHAVASAFGLVLE
jgi:hypothetical protein